MLATARPSCTYLCEHVRSSCVFIINLLSYIVGDADEAKIAANSTDVIQLLKTLQELLQNAIQKKRPTRLWESVYTISGPLTWKDFHLLAGRGWYLHIYLFVGMTGYPLVCLLTIFPANLMAATEWLTCTIISPSYVALN